MADASSLLGFGLLAAFCTAVLPYPDGAGGIVMRAVTTVQPTLGVGTDPRKPGAGPLPSTAGGRQLLGGALLCRLVTTRGTLIDTTIPTTTAQFGIDIADAADADMTTAEVGQLAAQIDAQTQADERVKTSLTTATLLGSLLILAISVVDGAGPFKLTLTIDVLTGDVSVLASAQ